MAQGSLPVLDRQSRIEVDNMTARPQDNRLNLINPVEVRITRIEGVALVVANGGREVYRIRVGYISSPGA